VPNDMAVTIQSLRGLANIARNAISKAKGAICSTYCHFLTSLYTSRHGFIANVVSTKGLVYGLLEILPLTSLTSLLIVMFELYFIY
jgi:hypothetical protein